MANDVIYPDGVTLSDAEHSALQSLNLHAQNGRPAADVQPVSDAIAAAKEQQAAAAENLTSAEIDASTEQQPTWEGTERRSGSDRRVLDQEWSGDERRVATEDRRAEPPAKTEIDTTVTQAPEQPQSTSVGPVEPAPVSEIDRLKEELATDEAKIETAVKDVFEPTQTEAPAGGAAPATEEAPASGEPAAPAQNDTPLAPAPPAQA